MFGDITFDIQMFGKKGFGNVNVWGDDIRNSYV